MTTSTDIAENIIDSLVGRHERLMNAFLPPLVMAPGLAAMREWYYFAESSEDFNSHRKKPIDDFVETYVKALISANDAAGKATKTSTRPPAKEAKAALDALRLPLKQVFTARYAVLGRGDAASNLAEYLGEALSAEIRSLTPESQSDTEAAYYLGGLTLLQHFFAPGLSENYGFSETPPESIVGRISKLNEITKLLSLEALLNPPYSDDLRGATGNLKIDSAVSKYSIKGTLLTSTCELWWKKYVRFRSLLILLIGKSAWIWKDGNYCIELSKRVPKAKQWVYSTFFTEAGAPKITVTCSRNKIKSKEVKEKGKHISDGASYQAQIKNAVDRCTRANSEVDSFAREIDGDLFGDLVGESLVQTAVIAAIEAVPFVGALVATARAAHACGVALAEGVRGKAFETRVEWVAADEKNLSGKYFALTALSQRYSDIQTVAAARSALHKTVNAALKWTPIPNIVTALISGGVEGALKAGDLSFEAKLASQVLKTFQPVGPHGPRGNRVEELWEFSGLVPSLLSYLIGQSLDPAVRTADNKNTDGPGFFGDLAFLLFADEEQGHAARRAQVYLAEKNEKSPFPFVVVATGGAGT